MGFPDRFAPRHKVLFEYVSEKLQTDKKKKKKSVKMLPQSYRLMSF